MTRWHISTLSITTSPTIPHKSSRPSPHQPNAADAPGPLTSASEKGQTTSWHSLFSLQAHSIGGITHLLTISRGQTESFPALDMPSNPSEALSNSHNSKGPLHRPVRAGFWKQSHPPLHVGKATVGQQCFSSVDFHPRFVIKTQGLLLP